MIEDGHVSQMQILFTGRENPTVFHCHKYGNQASGKGAPRWTLTRVVAGVDPACEFGLSRGTQGGGGGGTGGQQVLMVFSTNTPREKQGDGGA